MRLLAVALTFLAACASVVPYERRDRFTRDEAAAIVRQGFEEQPKGLRPSSISIDADAIRLIDDTATARKLFAGATTVRVPDTLYYSAIGELTFVEKSNYRIILRNKERSFQRLVVFLSKDRAVDFLDALYRLARKD